MPHEELLKKYQNQYGIIMNIKELTSELSRMCSYQELIEIEKYIFYHNNTIYAQLQRNIQGINDNLQITGPIIEPKVVIQELPKPILLKKDDVTEYIIKLRTAKNENELLTIIQNITDHQLLNAIYYKLWEYIIFYKREIQDYQASTEDKNFCNTELNQLDDIVLTIMNYVQLLESTNASTIKTNKLIFLSDDENYFLEDLKRFDQSEYHSVYSLLSSIIIGTFIRNRTFHTSGNPIYEIRSINNYRILYDRLYKDFYIILYLFKKNNNFIYKNIPEERYKIYREQQKKWQEQLQSNDKYFINEQFQIQQNILETLNSKIRRK